MQKFYIPILIVLVAVIGGVLIYQNSQKVGNDLPSKAGTVQTPGASDSQQTSKELTVTEKDNIQGLKTAQVTIVEFSDFQCPFCGSFQPTMNKIAKEFPDKVRWVYKHFPLDQIHDNARPAAEAAECAAEQGKFWEYSDQLFENQAKLGGSFYKELAGQLNLNMDQFNNCVSSRKYKDKVEADLQEGIKAGVRGTPSSFINGELVSGAVTYEKLKQAVEKALSQ